MGAVLIIGGYGGIGEALTRRLTAADRSVIIAGRSLDKAQALAHDCGQKAMAWDARDETAWQQAMEELDAEGTALDAVVNLCGSILLKPLASTSLSELRETLDQNLVTAFLSIKFGAPRLAEVGGGSLVLMSSVAARYGLVNHEAIAAAKAAVEGLVVASAASFAAKNVRINAVAPGLVETPLSHRFVSSEEGKKASSLLHPLGRIGQPVDIACVVSMLLDPDCSWMTGQVLAVDGGMSHVKSRR